MLNQDSIPSSKTGLFNPRALRGKTAIVTGASRNLGADFALGLAACGARIVIHYHAKESAQAAFEVCDQANQASDGENAIAVQADLTQPQQVKRLFSEAESIFGDIDVVVNNAGVMHKAQVAQTTDEDFDRVFATNAKAPFLVMREAAIRAADNSSIINIGTSLLGAFVGNYAAYAGSKAPLEDFTRALAKELGHRGVSVNTLCPGPVDTDFLAAAENTETLQYLAQGSVYQRLGQPSDITPWVLFLASADSSWMTGQTIFVNGGFATR